MRLSVAIVALCAAVVLAFPAAGDEWRPPDLQATSASLDQVLRVYRHAIGDPDPGYERRRERWTYRVGDKLFPVHVAVAGDDFRVSVALPDGTYEAGRAQGFNWRADASGVAHGTLADAQGDAVDRLPYSVLPFDVSACSLAGESTRYGDAWVIVDREAQDRPHWFYVSRATGTIVREETREGRRVVVTTFSDFATVGGVRRAMRWHVARGDAANDLDVTVEAVEPGHVERDDIRVPAFRAPFSTAFPSGGRVTLPTTWHGETILVDATIAGRAAKMVLDTGTASITIGAAAARAWGFEPSLEHVSVPEIRIGESVARNVSLLALPFGRGRVAGILGYDFFFGSIVHIDYPDRRVELLSHEAAESVFGGSGVAVVPMDIEEGLPFVPLVVGGARGERFALDTGSPHLYVLDPFLRRYDAIAERWSAGVFADGNGVDTAHYLEGSIAVKARIVPAVQLGSVRFTDLPIGVETHNPLPDALDTYMDGIFGTDELRFFDVWLDYDQRRMALRFRGEGTNARTGAYTQVR